MNTIGKILLKGLAAVLPIGLTLYLVYWLAVTVESAFRPIIVFILAEQYYWPGFGLIAGLVSLFFVGLAVNAWIVQRVIRLGENLLEKIPLIKSVYGALRDFMDYFSPSRNKDELEKVVLVSINELQLIGFVTGGADDMPGITSKTKQVAVYLPMSYQLGGFTVYLPETAVQTLDISVEDAMRRVLTAGLSTRSGK